MNIHQLYFFLQNFAALYFVTIITSSISLDLYSSPVHTKPSSSQVTPSSPIYVIQNIRDFLDEPYEYVPICQDPIFKPGIKPKPGICPIPFRPAPFLPRLPLPPPIVEYHKDETLYPVTFHRRAVSLDTLTMTPDSPPLIHSILLVAVSMMVGAAGMHNVPRLASRPRRRIAKAAKASSRPRLQMLTGEITDDDDFEEGPQSPSDSLVGRLWPQPRERDMLSQFAVTTDLTAVNTVPSKLGPTQSIVAPLRNKPVSLASRRSAKVNNRSTGTDALNEGIKCTTVPSSNVLFSPCPTYESSSIAPAEDAEMPTPHSPDAMSKVHDLVLHAIITDKMDDVEPPACNYDSHESQSLLKQSHADLNSNSISAGKSTVASHPNMASMPTSLKIADLYNRDSEQVDDEGMVNTAEPSTTTMEDASERRSRKATLDSISDGADDVMEMDTLPNLSTLLATEFSDEMMNTNLLDPVDWETLPSPGGHSLIIDGPFLPNFDPSEIQAESSDQDIVPQDLPMTLDPFPPLLETSFDWDEGGSVQVQDDEADRQEVPRSLILPPPDASIPKTSMSRDSEALNTDVFGLKQTCADTLPASEEQIVKHEDSSVTKDVRNTSKEESCDLPAAEDSDEEIDWSEWYEGSSVNPFLRCGPNERDDGDLLGAMAMVDVLLSPIDQLSPEVEVPQRSWNRSSFSRCEDHKREVSRCLILPPPDASIPTTSMSRDSEALNTDVFGRKEMCADTLPASTEQTVKHEDSSATKDVHHTSKEESCDLPAAENSDGDIDWSDRYEGSSLNPFNMLRYGPIDSCEDEDEWSGLLDERLPPIEPQSPDEVPQTSWKKSIFCR